jgi:hypothetical protein
MPNLTKKRLYKDPLDDPEMGKRRNTKQRNTDYSSEDWRWTKTLLHPSDANTIITSMKRE